MPRANLFTTASARAPSRGFSVARAIRIFLLVNFFPPRSSPRTLPRLHFCARASSALLILFRACDAARGRGPSFILAGRVRKLSRFMRQLSYSQVEITAARGELPPPPPRAALVFTISATSPKSIYVSRGRGLKNNSPGHAARG